MWENSLVNTICGGTMRPRWNVDVDGGDNVRGISSSGAAVAGCAVAGGR